MDAVRPAAVGAKLIAQLEASTNAVSEAFTEQQRGIAMARSAARERQSRRGELRRTLLRISQTAPAVNTPAGAHLTFRMPKGCRDQQLMALGRAVHGQVLPHAAVFARLYQTDRVVAGLPDQIDALDATIARQWEGRRIQAAAKATIAAQLTAGSRAMDGLACIYTNALHADAPAMAEWKSARRVGPRRVRRRAKPRQRRRSTTAR